MVVAMTQKHDYQQSIHAKGQCAYCGELEAHPIHGKSTELTSLKEIKQRLAAIEQAQGVLCERLDALAAIVQNGQMQEHKNLEAILTKLDALQAKELIGDFKRNGRKSWRKSKKRK